VFTATGVLGIVAYNQNVSEQEKEPTQIEQIYDQYLVCAKAEGKTPLSYEEWLVSIKGEQGEKGENGTDGESAYQIWLDNGHTGSEADFIT
jgi:hypothetical protein